MKKDKRKPELYSEEKLLIILNEALLMYLVRTSIYKDHDKSTIATLPIIIADMSVQIAECFFNLWVNKIKLVDKLPTKKHGKKEN